MRALPAIGAVDICSVPSCGALSIVPVLARPHGRLNASGIGRSGEQWSCATERFHRVSRHGGRDHSGAGRSDGAQNPGMTSLDEEAATSRGRLHFFCGKAGAGKSTLARSIAESEQATLISEDVWLSRLYGAQMQTFDDYRRLSLRLKTVVGPLAVDLLCAGRHVVLDFPANTRIARDWFRSLAEQSGADHVLHFLDSSDSDCLSRINKRNAERPEGSHHLTPELFFHISAHFEPPQDEERLHVRRHSASAT